MRNNMGSTYIMYVTQERTNGSVSCAVTLNISSNPLECIPVMNLWPGFDLSILKGRYMSLVMRKPVFGVSDRSVQSQKIARSLKFWI